MAIIKSTSARRTSTAKSAASKSASSKTAASKSTSSTSSGTLNSNGYRDNFDYSAAIAGTTDSAKRQQLLSERQNKIDSLGLGGKVASNDAVSTWNGTYRPYSVSSTTTGASRVSSLYDAAENARFKRFETARSRIARQLESNLASIENDYAAGMRQTDINARQSAVNNEEKLAALGLNMGARGQAATSGMAETSRIAVDNRYRSDLNSLGQARLSARAAAQNAADEQTAAAESSYYTASENAALQQAQAALSQFNADRDYGLSVAGLTGFLNGTPTLNWRNYQLNVSSAAANAQTREKLVAVHEIFDILVDLADVQNLSFHVYSPCSQVRTAMPMALSVENSGGEKTASKSRQDCRSCALDATPPEKTTGKPGYCFSASRVTETIHEQTQLSTYFAVSAGLPVAA